MRISPFMTELGESYNADDVLNQIRKYTSKGLDVPATEAISLLTETDATPKQLGYAYDLFANGIVKVRKNTGVADSYRQSMQQLNQLPIDHDRTFNAEHAMVDHLNDLEKLLL